MVAVWREANRFGRAERAALAWCEALTLLPDSGAPDGLVDELSRHFTLQQVVALTLASVAIKCWNRLNLDFRTTVVGLRDSRSAFRIGHRPDGGSSTQQMGICAHFVAAVGDRDSMHDRMSTPNDAEPC